MRRALLAAATSLALAGLASAQERGQFPHGAAAAKIAMGPVSAAHLPSGGGTTDKQEAPACAAGSDPCPAVHKKAKARHKQTSGN